MAIDDGAEANFHKSVGCVVHVTCREHHSGPVIIEPLCRFVPLQFNFGEGQCCGWRLLSRKNAIMQVRMGMRISNAEAEKRTVTSNFGQCAARLLRGNSPFATIPTPTHPPRLFPVHPSPLPPFLPHFPASTTSPPSGTFFSFPR